MFTIVISEKGGAERREAFSKDEISVGRVQGNDLMLAKGNVSKQHARLLFRDGRFVVTDLKSTNGTYVNGRKITQATVVRDGDKIYIGDFVLRLDSASAETAQPQPSFGETADAPDGAPPPNPFMTPGPPLGSMPGSLSGAPPQATPFGTPVGGPGTGPQRLTPLPAGGFPPMPARAVTAQSAQPPPIPPMPQASTMNSPGNPPPVGLGRGSTLHLPPTAQRSQSSLPGTGPVGAAPSKFPPLRDPNSGTAAPSNSNSPNPPPVPPAQQGLAQQGISQQPVQRASVPPRPKDSPALAARKLALVTLVDRVLEGIELPATGELDDALRKKIDESIREEAKGMHAEGEVPDGADMDQVARDTLLELTALGPLGPLLEDEDVLEIYATRFDQVSARRAHGVSAADVPFSSEEALRRTIHRFARVSGQLAQPGESILRRRIARGASLQALLPPVSAHASLTLRKRRKVEGAVEDLVRAGAMSRAMGTFVEACVAARASVLVVSSSPGALYPMAGALASAVTAGERMGLVQEVEELQAPHLHLLSIAADAPHESQIAALVGARVDRGMLFSMNGGGISVLTKAAAAGIEGLIGCLVAPALRHGLSRLANQLLLSEKGLSSEAARECIAESIDVAIEIHPLPDGRLRVTRISELAGVDPKGIVVRDIFNATDAQDGFAASGVMPRCLAEFASRGVRLDPNLFKRAPGR